MFYLRAHRSRVEHHLSHVLVSDTVSGVFSRESFARDSAGSAPLSDALQ
jgi:hypothetical protein